MRLYLITAEITAVLGLIVAFSLLVFLTLGGQTLYCTPVWRGDVDVDVVPGLRDLRQEM